ncbi:MAG: hypothetical protein V4539_01395 [Bacteroidota bacterium]
METCKALRDFYSVIADNARIGASHISVYVALLTRARDSPDGNVVMIMIHRIEIIKIAKVSRRTYNKCMRDLEESGYIKYEPSSDPATLSKVWLNKLL